MFDANMRYLPEGHKFIAEVWWIKEGTVLHQCGVRRDDYLLCTMMEDDIENPRVTVHLKDHDVVVSSHGESLFAYSILYIGTVEGDGSLIDFAYKEDLIRAENFMETIKKTREEDNYERQLPKL